MKISGAGSDINVSEMGRSWKRSFVSINVFIEEIQLIIDIRLTDDFEVGF